MSASRCVVLAVVLLFSGMIFFRFFENLSWVDALYFSNATLSSIGFGDIVPNGAVGKVGAVVFSLLGMGVYADFIVCIGSELQQKHFFGVIISCVLCFSVGVIAFSWLENWGIQQSMIFVFFMSTTTGYGDIAPVTSEGRIVSVFLSFWSLHCFAELLSLIKNWLYHTCEGAMLASRNLLTRRNSSDSIVSGAVKNASAVQRGGARLRRRASRKSRR